MTKKILVSTTLAIAVLLVPASVNAKTVCTQEYGQPVVCEDQEVKGVVHEPKETAFGDIDFAAVGAGFMLASGVLLALSKRKSSGSILIN